MRIIKIGRLGVPPASDCGEDSGEVPKLDLPLARREFLKGSGILMGTLASGSGARRCWRPRRCGRWS